MNLYSADSSVKCPTNQTTISELNLLLCVFHLEKGDRKKLLQLNPQKGAVKRILADITTLEIFYKHCDSFN